MGNCSCQGDTEKLQEQHKRRYAAANKSQPSAPPLSIEAPPPAINPAWNQEATAKAAVKRDKKLLTQIEKARKSGASWQALTNIDLAFVMDATSSMDPHIDAAKANVCSIIDELRGQFAQASVRYSCIAYRDINDTNRMEIFPFNSDPSLLKAWLEGIEATGGADLPEDLTGALVELQQLEWRNPTRVGIIIADAPCHGTQYHNVTPEDYPNGDPDGRNPENVVAELCTEQKVNLHFFRINKSTDRMIEVLSRAYNRGQGHSAWRLMTHQIGDHPEMFLKRTVASISSSISSTSARSATSFGQGGRLSRFGQAWKTKKQFRKQGLLQTLTEDAPAKYQEAPPEYQEVWSHEWGDQERVDVFTVESQGASTGTATVRMALAPFAEGGMRAAFYMYHDSHLRTDPPSPLGCTETFVLKEPTGQGAAYNSKEAVFGDLDSMHSSSVLANQWNQLHGHHGLVTFVPAFVIDFKDRVDAERRYMMVEPVLPGGPDAFRKFNSNNGFFDPMPDAALAQTFSHWTWHATNGEFIVLDIQGVVDTTTVQGHQSLVLTDPQIQCSDTSRYGRGNLGDAGIATFFSRHECNALCHQLMLRKPGSLTEQQALSAQNSGVDVPQPLQVIPEEQTRPRAAGGEEWKPAPLAMVAPTWVENKTVFRCQCQTQCSGIEFGAFKWRHHCRACGNVVCSACSMGKLRLPYANGLQRICDRCMDKLTGGVAMASEQQRA